MKIGPYPHLMKLSASYIMFIVLFSLSLFCCCFDNVLLVTKKTRNREDECDYMRC